MPGLEPGIETQSFAFGWPGQPPSLFTAAPSPGHDKKRLGTLCVGVSSNQSRRVWEHRGGHTAVAEDVQRSRTRAPVKKGRHVGDNGTLDARLKAGHDGASM